MKTQYQKFYNLHQQEKPFYIGNVWNVQSAKAFAKQNYKALGTSSAAIAHSLGYEDGEQMSFRELKFIVERIINQVNLPLSVDIEAGYGETSDQIVENIIQLAELGVTGINIEDSIVENNNRSLRNPKDFGELIKVIRTELNSRRIELFINVRCDAFLIENENPLQVAKSRISEYELNGTDGIFLPCLRNYTDIKEIVNHTKLPLNVMTVPNLPEYKFLQDLGVKRISFGNFLNDFVYNTLENISQKIIKNDSYNLLFK
ncbi:isocitrate lyase/PEP mutase family protein [Empedobacter brevis]|uniref:isocitrate lyase/PEP mutase family protein n=1 Tax=Empedobacter brevis TaxID=247 RepID=UPI0033423C4E